MCLGVSVRTIMRLVSGSEPRLRSHYVGRRRLIEESELRRFKRDNGATRNT